MPTLDNIITTDSIKTYFDEYKRNSNVEPYLGEALFPVVRQDSLDLKFMTGEEGLPVVLKPTAYDAEVPLRDRIGLTLVQGEMPFYREGFLVKEIDRREIQRANSASDPAMKAAVGHIYKDMRRLVDGANAAAERMRMQILAPTDGRPKITINANGVNMVYNYDPAGTYVANNYLALSGTSKWTAYSTADPVKDFDDAKTAMAGKGVRIVRAVMNNKTFSDMKKSTALWNYAISTLGVVGGTIFHSDALAKEIIFANTGIEIIVYNKQYVDEAGNTQYYIPNDVVAFIPEGTLGETRAAATPEEYAYAGKANAPVAVTVLSNGVSISTKSWDIPVKEEIIAGMIAMPSYEAMYTTYTIKTA